MLKSWRANFCPKRHYDWNLSQLVLPCSWWRQQKDLSHLSSMFWEPPEKFKQAGDWCRCQMKIMKLPVIIKFINFWRAQTSRLQMLQFLSFPKHNTIETCPNWSCLGGVGGVSRRILLQCFTKPEFIKSWWSQKDRSTMMHWKQVIWMSQPRSDQIDSDVNKCA